ncbi:MAG TPA: hypothetical protein VL443_30000 [Cyclobacteriaceae bacterium]|jgi:hypothetical protein|nr:hypothetical protein [Cyclobacteriaceae bacterium]
MKGRKPLYDIESLQIGEKLRLPKRIERFKDQYLYAFKGRNKQKDFKIVEEEEKIYIERVA